MDFAAHTLQYRERFALLNKAKESNMAKPTKPKRGLSALLAVVTSHSTPVPSASSTPAVVASKRWRAGFELYLHADDQFEEDEDDLVAWWGVCQC